MTISSISTKEDLIRIITYGSVYDIIDALDNRYADKEILDKTMKEIYRFPTYFKDNIYDKIVGHCYVTPEMLIDIIKVCGSVNVVIAAVKSYKANSKVLKEAIRNASRFSDIYENDIYYMITTSSAVSEEILIDIVKLSCRVDVIKRAIKASDLTEEFLNEILNKISLLPPLVTTDIFKAIDIRKKLLLDKSINNGICFVVEENTNKKIDVERKSNDIRHTELIDMEKIIKGDYSHDDFVNVEDKLYILNLLISEYNEREASIINFIKTCLGDEYCITYNLMKQQDIETLNNKSKEKIYIKR